MKQFCAYLLLISFAIYIHATPHSDPIFQSVLVIPGSNGKTTHLSTSPNGITFVAGIVNGQIFFGRLSSLDSKSKLDWSIKATSAEIPRVMDISSNDQSVVAIIRFKQEINICGVTKTGGVDIVTLVIVKVSESGECEWVKDLVFKNSLDADSSHTLTASVAISEAGLIYISSTFDGHLILDSVDVDNYKKALSTLPFLLTLESDGSFKYFQKDLFTPQSVGISDPVAETTESDDPKLFVHCPIRTCTINGAVYNLPGLIEHQSESIMVEGVNYTVTCTLTGDHKFQDGGPQCVEDQVKKRSTKNEKEVYMPTKIVVVKTANNEQSLFLSVDTKSSEGYKYTIMRREIDENGKSKHKFSFLIQSKPKPAHGYIFVPPHPTSDSGVYISARSAGVTDTIIVARLSFKGDLIWSREIQDIGEIDPQAIPAAPITGTCTKSCQIFVAGPSTANTNILDSRSEIMDPITIDVWPNHHGFIASFSEGGDILWLKEVFQNAQSGAIASLASFDEEIYVGGTVSGTDLKFNWVGGVNATEPSAFVARMAPTETRESVDLIEFEKIGQNLGLVPMVVLVAIVLAAASFFVWRRKNAKSRRTVHVESL